MYQDCECAKFKFKDEDEDFCGGLTFRLSDLCHGVPMTPCLLICMKAPKDKAI